jgi:PBP1b-binding outer membrane lipoprotein LpoB
MKKLVLILLLGLGMASCSNTPTEVKNPKEVTTVELQQLASIDSTTYKVVEKDDTVYVMSTKDNTVVKKVENLTGNRGSMIILVMVLFIIVWLIIIFKD